MIKRHFLRFSIWYVITLFALGAVVTWWIFNNRIEDINEEIELRKEEK